MLDVSQRNGLVAGGELSNRVSAFARWRRSSQSGKERPLLAAPPLRTVRASFPAHGSSHDETPGGAGGEPPSRSGWQCSKHAVLPDAAGRRHHEVFFPAFPPCGGVAKPTRRRMTRRKWARLSPPGILHPGIHAITARPSLSPPSSTRYRHSSPCGSPAPEGAR